MEEILIDGLSVGAVTVALCTSQISSSLRRLPYLRRVLGCCFCSSFWLSLAFDPSGTVFATMAVGNVTILLIHWSMTTYGDDDEETT